jgi:hypothetical protein
VTGSEVALFAFTACNTLRVVAYVPQLLKIARDNGGASAISYTTWGLFGASHLSTVAYAVAVVQDWKLGLIFTANALACGAIVGLTLCKRLRFAARRRGAQPDDLGPNTLVPMRGELTSWRHVGINLTGGSAVNRTALRSESRRATRCWV